MLRNEMIKREREKKEMTNRPGSNNEERSAWETGKRKTRWNRMKKKRDNTNENDETLNTTADCTLGFEPCLSHYARVSWCAAAGWKWPFGLLVQHPPSFSTR
jgi:hypothetical protein